LGNVVYRLERRPSGRWQAHHFNSGCRPNQAVPSPALEWPLLPKSAMAVQLSRLAAVHPVREKTFSGAFANRNVVCRLRDAATLNFLVREFGPVD